MRGAMRGACPPAAPLPSPMLHMHVRSVLSRHNRGTALDVTLLQGCKPPIKDDLQTQRTL